MEKRVFGEWDDGGGSAGRRLLLIFRFLAFLYIFIFSFLYFLLCFIALHACSTKSLIIHIKRRHKYP